MSTLLAIAIGLTQIALTRDAADKVYETKERAELMYQHFEEDHRQALDEIRGKLDSINNQLGDSNQHAKHP